MPTLLETKFFPPAPRHPQVRRPAVVAKLEHGLRQHCPLTLVSAPAGYGKSLAVAAWLAMAQGARAWLSLDEADNDPGRFFIYVLAVLRRSDANFCPELFAALQAGQRPNAETLTIALVNAMLGWTSPRVLVLDDFHHIQDKTILEVVTNILTHAPHALCLVLVTREDPPLPLARLRARGQLNEIRAADLRFSEAEAACLLRDSLRLELAAEDVSRLTEHTEGWVAGLQLAGLSLQGKDNPGAFVQTLSGSHRFILDYLTEETLKIQPPDVQSFLLQTSILPRLSAGLCDAVTERTDSAAVLERLLSANLFIIALDDEGRWYRYHHLFAEMLQASLRRQQPHAWPGLHQRASLWHEAQAMPLTSLEHAQAAGATAQVVRLLEKYGWRLLTQGHAPTLEKCALALPETVRNASLHINTMLVWSKILHGDYGPAMPYWRAAHTTLENLPPQAASARALQADLLALQSLLAQAQGQPDEALTLAEKSRSLALPEDTRLTASTALALGVACRTAGRFDEAIEQLETAMHAAHTIDDHITAMVAVAHLSLIWYPLGRLRRLAEKAELAIERAETLSRLAPLMIGSVHAVVGQVYYEWNHIEKARASLLHGLRLASLASQPASLIYARVALARLYQGEGDLASAATCLREAEDVLTHGGPLWARPDWVGQQVSLLVAQGKFGEAENLLGTTGIPLETPVTYRTEVIHLAWLRCWLARHKPEALALAQRIIHSAEAGRRNGTLIRALVLGAQAGGGEAWLARAHQLAQPEGYQRVFLDERLDGHTTAISAPFQALTEREREVLFLLSEGLTYAQIAARLVVSVNTVRYHVKGVYAKLGVEKQTQAIEQGRKLGLL